MIFCLDGGTTNTRLRLLDGETVIDTEKMPIGSSSPDRGPLFAGVRSMAETLLSRHGLTESDIPVILAVGMVTSEFGLYEVPHLIAPAGPDEFKNGMKTVTLPEITSIPFCFIPGLRNAPDSFQMMRGEETECIGNCLLSGVDYPAAVILPGSHNKVILWDGRRITECLSTLSGELISAAANHTILRNCVGEPFPKTFDREKLFAGADYAEENGLTAALLVVRGMSMNKKKKADKAELFSFLVGAILREDIKAIAKAAGNRTLVIGGSDPLREELSLLARRSLPNPVVTVDDTTAERASAVGALRIYGK